MCVSGVLFSVSQLFCVFYVNDGTISGVHWCHLQLASVCMDFHMLPFLQFGDSGET